MSTPTIDWRAAAWWWPADSTPQPLDFADFACDLDLSVEIPPAWLALSCGSWYTLWIDGVWVAHGPPREAAPWQYYDVVELGPWLHRGRNRLRLRVWHLGVKTQYHAPGAPGLMLQGMLGDVRLDQPSRWRAARSPGFLPGFPLMHGCVGYGEHVDLTADAQAWLTADADPEWASPQVLTTQPLPDREHLLANDLPPFTGATWEATLLHLRDGQQVWDFGREVFGFVTAELEADAPLTCDLLQGESLTRDGVPDHAFSRGDFRDCLELPAARRCWHSFEKRALRYLALPQGVTVHRLAVREHHQPLIEVWRTRTDLSARDRAIIAAAARTVTLCCDDLLNDCPRRERAQYHDPAVYQAAFPLLFGTAEPLRRWLRQMLRGAGADGVLPMCYPSPPGMTVIPDFSIAFAQNLHTYLDLTGDLETARACFAGAVASVEHFTRHADASGLLVDVPGWVFLCNSFEVAKHPRSAGLNALWAGSFSHLADLAERLGSPGAAEYRARHAQLRQAWRATFWRTDRIRDSDRPEPTAERQWWTWHAEAERGHFVLQPEPPITVVVPWHGPARRLAVMAAGRICIRLAGRVLLDAAPENPWATPHLFEPWEIDLPAGFTGGDLEIELAANTVDCEFHLAADGGAPGPMLVEGRETACRPWAPPRWSQITAGYAIDAGMLEPAEARALAQRCLRAEYHVPWRKRTTPLICTPTTERALIAERAVLCNTPHSLSFFCRALKRVGLAAEAQDLCRRLFGAMLDAGATTLWEEFAPRSSLCHAWSAMCVEHLLPPLSAEQPE